MNATTLGLELAFQLGGCASTLERGHGGHPSVTKDDTASPAGEDYCLYDEKGARIGVISAARSRPVLGRNASTVYLRREPTGTSSIQRSTMGTSGSQIANR